MASYLITFRDGTSQTVEAKELLVVQESYVLLGANDEKVGFIPIAAVLSVVRDGQPPKGG